MRACVRACVCVCVCVCLHILSKFTNLTGLPVGRFDCSNDAGGFAQVFFFADFGKCNSFTGCTVNLGMYLFSRFDRSVFENF